MIVTVTPNPSLDRTARVPGFRRGGVHKLTCVEESAGGKGLNLARAYRSLGGRVRSVGFAGGDVGRRLSALAAREGLEWVPVPVEGNTRSNLTLIDGEGPETHLVELGPGVGEAEAERLLETAAYVAEGAWAVALCGSFPPGMPLSFVGRLKEALGGTALVADVAGEALALAVDAGVAGVAPNAEELGGLTGTLVNDHGEAAALCGGLLERGVGWVLCKMGEAGAVLVTEAERLAAAAGPVDAVDTVGCGDAALAGLLFAFESGACAEEALRLAVGCGAAAAVSGVPARFDPELARRLAQGARTWRV